VLVGLHEEVALGQVHRQRGLPQPHAQHLHQARREAHRLDKPAALLQLRLRPPVVDAARIRPHAPFATPLVANHCADLAGKSSVDSFDLSCHNLLIFSVY
jgi:hypothetical protein